MKKANVMILGAVMSGSLTANLVGAIAAGVGSDSSFLVLESPNVGLRTYEVFYDFDPASPLGTDDLLTIVDGADALISFTFGGAPENQFLTGIIFNGVAENSDFSDSNAILFWAQWVAGGEAGFDNETFEADPQPRDGDDLVFRRWCFRSLPHRGTRCERCPGLQRWLYSSQHRSHP